MASNLGTINVVFQADVATALAGLRALSQQLDASIASSIARSNQFSTAVSTMSTNLASSVARTAAGAQAFSNSVTNSFGQIPNRLAAAVSQISRNGSTLTNSLGTITGQLTVTVDQATDTVTGRTTVANPDGVLIDGQLVTVILERGQPIEKPVVPQQALIADQGGLYVFVVEDGKAVVRRVKPGIAVGPDVAIDDGLKPGDQVIIEGIERIRPGAAVLAMPVAALKAN